MDMSYSSSVVVLLCRLCATALMAHCALRLLVLLYSLTATYYSYYPAVSMQSSEMFLPQPMQGQLTVIQCDYIDHHVTQACASFNHLAMTSVTS